MIIAEFTETIKLALSALKGSKLRSGLASLGVVIGISLVIMMGWMLAGLDSAFVDTVNTLGVDVLYIDRMSWTDHDWDEMKKRRIITEEQYNEFEKRMTGAELVFPVLARWRITIEYENKSYDGFRAFGTTAAYGGVPFGEIEFGRNFSEYEDQTAAPVIVVGEKVYSTIFPNGDGIGKYIRIKGRSLKVIGVIKKQGTALNDEMDTRTYLPLKMFKKLFGASRRGFMICVKAGGEEKLDEVREEAHGIMRQIRDIYPGEKDDYSINETKAFDRMLNQIRSVLWGVGIGMTVLSFAVGIIGIMNIMFVSVTERIKEIGIRKSIGAKRRSIWMQFLVEAATLSFLGAFVSIVICSLLAWAAATFLPEQIPELKFLKPYLPVQLLFIACFVSIAVGVMAGLIPAIRASRLDPVDALRYE